MTTNLALVLLVVLLIVIGPLLSSAFICVPKWYRNRVAHTKLGKLIRKLSIRSYMNYALPEWSKYVVAGAAFIILLPIILIAGIVFLWWDAWRAIIYRACPYTAKGEPPWNSPIERLINTTKHYFN